MRPYHSLLVCALIVGLSSFALAQECVVNQEGHPVTENPCLAIGPKIAFNSNTKFYFDYLESQYWVELEVLDPTAKYRRTLAGNKVNFSFVDGTQFTLTSYNTLEPREQTFNLIFTGGTLYWVRYRCKIKREELESLRDKEIKSITYHIGEQAPFYVKTGKRRSERQLKKFERNSKVEIKGPKKKRQERSQSMVRCILEAPVPTSEE